MQAALTARGRWFALTGILLLGAGAAAGVTALAALGFLALATLCVAYLRHAPRVADIFAGGLKLAWWLEPETPAARTIMVGRPLLLQVALRCHGRARLGVACLRAVTHPALEVPGDLSARVEPLRETRLCVRVTPRAAGSHVIHGAMLDVDDLLGLFRAQAYFPNPLKLVVMPRALAAAVPQVGGRATSEERAGKRLLRRVGLGLELREIREHAHGDPWKRIAWAATARTGQLMVREFESDVTYTYHLLVDASAAMRRGPLGETALDVAIDGATAVTRAALAQGDRVALTIFAGRSLASVEAGDGPVHLSRVLAGLLEACRLVDEDLTDLTDGELAQVVARYLRHQEGVEAQLDRAPALDDPGWARIVTGPRGELYDLHLLGRACRELTRDSDRRPRGTDADTGAMRRLCRLRGLDLPPRTLAPASHGRAVADALVAAAQPRGARVLVLWTTLGKDPDDEPAAWQEPVRRALLLVRRHRHRLALVMPVAPRPTDHASGDPIGEMWARADRHRAQKAAHRMRLLGLDVHVVAADEPPALWLRRVGRAGLTTRLPALAS